MTIAHKGPPISGNIKINTPNNIYKRYNKISNILFWSSYGFLFLLIGIWFGNLKLKKNIIIADIDVNNPLNKNEKLLAKLLIILNIFEYIFIIFSFGFFLSFYIYTLQTDHNKKMKQFLMIFGTIPIILYTIIYITRLLIFYYNSTDISLSMTLNKFYIGMVLLLLLAMVVKFVVIGIRHSIIRINEKKMLSEVVATHLNKKTQNFKQNFKQNNKNIKY